MAAYQGVFERKEVKYRLGAAQYRAMLEALKGRLAPDAYGSALVKSTYFDTEDCAMIARSLEKPLYKEKLRVRSYGAPGEGAPVYVEIKKKYDGVVYKRRVAMSYAAARMYLGGAPYEQACLAHPCADAAVRDAALSAQSRRAAREIDMLVRRWGPLRPSMLTCCVRTAYGPIDAAGVGRADEADLRVTFDSSLGYCDMRACAGAPRVYPLIAPDEVVMEVKSRGPYPMWLAAALSACGAYPSSFSKYGEAYRRCASASVEKPGKPSEVLCA